MKGNAQASQGINVALQFICDINSNIIDGHQATAIQSRACEIWHKLYKRKLMPKVWGDLSISAKNYYFHHMYQGFPELRLYEGYWKVL